ncbi:TIGR02281 family clan AA aspartic protease [Litoribrevibacter euphylliae]|uniref:TIGR02281 family clan AA aspartic protease n=1 Tax=Litoribrevibacter euphylliae TaxID=1834034 RepID=A0ABV7HJT3_9GAMM
MQKLCAVVLRVNALIPKLLRSRLAAFSLLLISSVTLAETSIHVEGLMNNMAVLKINGSQKILRVGQTSGGVKLISADAKQAVVLVDGQKKVLGLSGHISGQYQAPKKATVSIQQNNGQYLTSGSINGRPVRFLVDTGATSISMSMEEAQRLGIPVDRSNPIYVGTAGGRVIGYPVTLDLVKVGALKASYVRCVVLESGFTGEILLGMTFLQHVNIKHEKGFMVLEQNF